MLVGPAAGFRSYPPTANKLLIRCAWAGNSHYDYSYVDWDGNSAFPPYYLPGGWARWPSDRCPASYSYTPEDPWISYDLRNDP